jgi:two-component system OmpR family sensor kinase
MFSSLANRRFSLRTRLIAEQVGLLTLVCVIIVLATELALHAFLLGQLDDRIGGANIRSSNFSDRGPPGRGGGPPPPGANPPPPGAQPPGNARPGPDGAFNPVNAPGQAEGTLIARINPEGTMVNSGVVPGDGGDPDPIPLAQQVVLAELPADGQPHTRDLGSLGSYRLVSLHNNRDDVIITGLPTADMDTTLLNAGLWTGGIALAGLIAAGVVGVIIIRRSLAPLERVASTASRVARLRLDHGEVEIAERVPEADTDQRTEVGRVGLALNRLLGHVDNALSARQASETRVRQFVADASHELRTPLSAVRGYAELVRRSGETVSPDVAHALGRVESEAARMTTLVEDLLLLARLDSGRPLERQPVDLSRLVVDVASDARIAGGTHRWRLELPAEPVTVTGDDARLHQVLANLLSNARTHTPPGTTITTGLSTVDGEVLLRVADDGPGIPEHLLPSVFERFARGDSSRSRAAGSTGLGLAIVAAVVHAHHGSIEVTSQPGRTEFTVRLR